jgi:hypothetical protein
MPRKWFVENLVQAIKDGHVLLDGDGVVRIPRRSKQLLQSISPALQKNLGNHPVYPECVRYAIREEVLPLLDQLVESTGQQATSQITA